MQSSSTWPITPCGEGRAITVRTTASPGSRRKRMRRVFPFIVTLLVVVGCTTITQQKSQPAQNDNSQHHNLKVIPVNISHDELIAMMRGFTRALGTRCDHCHAAG